MRDTAEQRGYIYVIFINGRRDSRLRNYSKILCRVNYHTMYKSILFVCYQAVAAVPVDNVTVNFESENKTQLSLGEYDRVVIEVAFPPQLTDGLLVEVCIWAT